MFLKRTEPFLHLLPIPTPSPPPPVSGPSCCTSRGRGRCPQRGIKKIEWKKWRASRYRGAWSGEAPFTDVHAHRRPSLNNIRARARSYTFPSPCVCLEEKERGGEKTIELAATARTKNGPCPTLRTPCEIISRMRRASRIARSINACDLCFSRGLRGRISYPSPSFETYSI